MTDFADLSVKRRGEALAVAINMALAGVRGEVTTQALSELVAVGLGAKPHDIGRMLVKLAAAGDARARRTGETFTMYGRTMHRIAWRGALPAGASAEAIAAREAALYEPDPTQWDDV